MKYLSGIVSEDNIDLWDSFILNKLKVDEKCFLLSEELMPKKYMKYKETMQIYLL